MGDIQTRPFSRNYSGLINQSVIAIGITLLCATGQEVMKRRRRGSRFTEGLETRESWEFGYLYQGRSWARKPSPPVPAGWPISWVKPVVNFPEAKMLELRGVDATLYVRFLRGCFWFILLHFLTTFLVLFPIHVLFSGDDISPKSMTRASISSLVATTKGQSLLWIHVCLLFWLTFSWMGTLFWICNGAFQLRATDLESKCISSSTNANDKYFPHPHPQYGFTDIPSPDDKHPNTGLRLRTIMVSNIPHGLRNEKDLKEYFEYYMSRKLDKPSMGITSSTQPGFFNKSFAFLFNRVKRIPSHLPMPLFPPTGKGAPSQNGKQKAPDTPTSQKPDAIPAIERVVIARKMTELASLLHRREEILCLLETAHIQLANKALTAVKHAMEKRVANLPITQRVSKAAEIARLKRSLAQDPEAGPSEAALNEETRMDQLIEVLGPFVEEFGLQETLSFRSWKAFFVPWGPAFRRLHEGDSENSQNTRTRPAYPPSHSPTGATRHRTVWDALHSLPRSSLDPYQPLVNLNHLFRGQMVPAIDYYTAKLNILSSLITESRSKAVSNYEPVSTAFLTFMDPADARRACKYLAVHPNNPLECIVTMAPMYQDLDWIRVMKSSFNTEFVKDWVVNLGVWGFTLFWIFPVSLFVGLVSIQNISYFWPSLKRYLDRNRWQEEVIQSFLPTVLVALMVLLIPLILLLIAKKAHTITTLSALHDRIMTRYYKFLIVNVLVFFCVGTAALQSFLESFKSTTSTHLLEVVASSFPSAGPFYVGWLILTTALHGGIEIALIGLPLIMYPNTARQIIPRKRAVGIRPRTFNFYYWLPNHMLVLHVLLLFSILNPVVLPFGVLYFFVEAGVVKNQLIHVYAKQYEGNGQLILIRIVRYSLDGLILTQAVFLAYMVVLKKSVNVGLAAFLIVFTALVKILTTRMCRARFEQDDVAESMVFYGRYAGSVPVIAPDGDISDRDGDMHGQLNPNKRARSPSSFLTWKIPAWVNFSYSARQYLPHSPQPRHPNPFRTQEQDFSRLRSMSEDRSGGQEGPPDSHFTELPWGGAPISPDVTRGTPAYANGGSSGPVMDHPSPIPWDDQTTVDLPYDNPFYSRAYDNVLWLPRDPCGILDLDGTVDLKVSLTVEVTAGKLGTWLGLGETDVDEGMSEENHSLMHYSTKGNVSPIDGTEDIDLPASIAERIQTQGDDTVSSEKSSVRRRRISDTEYLRFGTTSRPGRAGRRPTISSENAFPLALHSFSGRTKSRFGAVRPSSSMPSLQIPQVNQHSPEREFPIQSDFQVHQEVAASSGDVSSLMSIPAPRSTKVSTREAIFHEVLAEERAALIGRIEDEQAETQKIATTKSWLTSWMFKKPE